MKDALRPLAVAAVLATSAVYFSGSQAATPDPKGWYGTPVTQGRADRVVEITPTTRFVNVDENQVVRFVVHGSPGRDESFMWQFNGGAQRDPARRDRAGRRGPRRRSTSTSPPIRWKGTCPSSAPGRPHPASPPPLSRG